MSATLLIREGGGETAIWMPPAAVFNDVLSCQALELTGVDDELSTALREAPEGFPYFDLRDLVPDRFRLLLTAAERAFRRCVASGPQALVKFTPYFGCLFSLLIALLRTDSRAHPMPGQVGSITIRNENIWSAPSWIFDLVLEHFAAEVRPEDEALALNLLAARVTEMRAQFDLSNVSQDRFSLILSATEWMYARYGDQKPRDFYAPAVIAELAPNATRLRASLHGVHLSSKQ